MKKNRKGFRQGDVLVVPVDKVPHGAVAVPPENDRVVLAHGEATGHHHSFPHNRGVVMFRDDGGAGGAYIDVQPNAAPLAHQEHTALAPAPGAYKVVRQRVAVSGLVRRVAD